MFTEPQIATVGLTEEQAIAAACATSPSATTMPGSPPAGPGRTRPGFVKLLADPDTGLLLGAHVIGPEAATVIQPLIQAMSFGQTARDVATGSTGSTRRCPR